jgi:hypothetical protein
MGGLRQGKMGFFGGVLIGRRFGEWHGFSVDGIFVRVVKIGAGSIPATDKRAKFVGLPVYMAANGPVIAAGGLRG